MARVMMMIETDDNLIALYDMLDESPMIVDYKLIEVYDDEEDEEEDDE